MVKKLPTYITQEEFEKLFADARKLEAKATGAKKKRIKEIRIAMLLAFEAGMRISEISGLGNKIQPLDKSQIEDASIRVISGKGGKDRVVPRPKRFNEAALKMLPLKVSRRTIQRFVTNLCKHTLNKNLSIHKFRHGFCTHLAASGRPLHEVQMLAGHSRLDTTGIYLHANPKKAIDGARGAF